MMGSFAKDWLQPLVNRISIKTLEKYCPSHTHGWRNYFQSGGSKVHIKKTRKCL